MTREPEIPDTRPSVPVELEAHHAKLRRVVESYGSMVVAYSGGVDSGLLAYVAHDVLGGRALPVIAVSPSLPRREKRAARDFLRRNGIPWEEVATGEMADENYVKNNPDRCYFCKSELFVRLNSLAQRRGYACIAYGANLDDLGDYRPGALAAGEQRIVSPLVEAGLTKHRVRVLARALGLSLWDKPAAPCLASRIPYFQQVTGHKLRQIERSENILKDHGFEVCRVRHHGETARIEVPRDDHERLLRDDIWAQVVAELGRIGFRRVTLHEDGFRSGRLNQALAPGRVAGGPGSD
jgi:uncharacterized protein